MNNPDPAFIATPVSGAIAVVLTIAQAVPAIDKRLGRVGEVESQVGRLPKLVRAFYVAIQRFYKWALLAISLVGVVMVFAYIFTNTFTHPIFAYLRENGIALIVLWLVLGATMYTNALSQLAMYTGWLLSTLVPVRNVFGLQRLDRHPAWPALHAFVNLNESAKPLIIDEKAAVTFADSLIRMFRSNAAVRNRAVPPIRPEGLDCHLFQQRLGNGLLAACIIEQAHYDGGATFPRRDWGPFYAAFGELMVETDLFSADIVKARHSSYDYYDTILNELNKHLLLRKQEEVPESFDLTERLKATFSILAQEYGGSVSAIDPGADRFHRSRLDRIYDRINRLPGLGKEGIRANFVKLAIVWDVWRNVPLRDFRFPFSDHLAALLMDRGVILAPDDIKALAFQRPEERQVQRAAMKVVVDRAIRLIENRRQEHESWLPETSRGAIGEVFKWWVAYELDFRIWDYARRLHLGKNIPAGDGLTRWKYENGQVARIKS